jgi:hypothetical protein
MQRAKIKVHYRYAGQEELKGNERSSYWLSQTRQNGILRIQKQTQNGKIKKKTHLSHRE